MICLVLIKYVDIDRSLQLNDKTNPSWLKNEGDKILYHNDGNVRWGGLFGQAKYKAGNWSIFANLTFAYSGYNRVDYFKKKDLVIDGKVYAQQVGYTRKFDLDQGGFVSKLDVVTIDGKEYTMNSPEARTSQTDWTYIPGYTLKLGANYNLTETQNVFVNAGYLNKAPRFANVYDNNNRKYRDIKNEKIMAFEVGYSYFNEKITVNLNAYSTYWENKPADQAFTFRDVR